MVYVTSIGLIGTMAPKMVLEFIIDNSFETYSSSEAVSLDLDFACVIKLIIT